ncbi:MAG: TetR/AcrR family transcriptional regulator [Solirubrobacterales bacterium]|nr:TetR/AcrR family transcriptional regulator [Solirubrobacterales bacterium]
MPGSRPDRPRRADFERNLTRIIEAATEVLAEDPTANMTEIARASGLVRATLYRHFPTREDLLIAICRDALERTAQAIIEAEPEHGSAPAGLARVIAALGIIGHRYRVISSGAVDIVAEPELMELAYAAFVPVNALVVRGQQEGTLRADMSDRWVVAAIVALIGEAARAADRGDLERADMAEHVRRMVLEPLVVG